jgi:hypothetical protein
MGQDHNSAVEESERLPGPVPGTPLVSKEDDTKLAAPGEQARKREVDYSIYTLSEKWVIVSMASLAALFR